MQNIKQEISKIKVTSRSKLLEVNNSMCHNYYYLIHCRLYNEDGTRYKKAKFVIWFDSDDLFDFLCYQEDDESDAEFDKRVESFRYTDADVMEFLDEMICNFLCNADDWNDLTKFYELCNQTIADYNR